MGTAVAGTARKFAGAIASALEAAIRAGLEEITHFEEVGILQEGIGADRISDITANLLRRRLAQYTAEVCERHGVETEVHRYGRGHFDATAGKWTPLQARLPLNPYNQRPVMLVPQFFLRDLPTINGQAFWDYCWDNENETIRAEYNYDVSRWVSKHDIIELARKHPEFREAYITDLDERAAKPYDFAGDINGVVRWYPATVSYCRSHPVPLSQPDSPDGFIGLVEQLVSEYRHYVEEMGGWRLLWNDEGTNRSEAAAQRLFLVIVQGYCRANDIDVAPETNIGVGAVDFKVTRGYALRALLELKLARNTRFWNGLTAQLPAYLSAERIRHGWFVVIVFSDADMDRLSDIARLVERVNVQTGRSIKHVIVDARRDRLSASKL